MEVYARVWETFSEVIVCDLDLIDCIGVGIGVFQVDRMSKGTQDIRHSRDKILEGLSGE